MNLPAMIDGEAYVSLPNFRFYGPEFIARLNDVRVVHGVDLGRREIFTWRMSDTDSAFWSIVENA